MPWHYHILERIQFTNTMSHSQMQAVLDVTAKAINEDSMWTRPPGEPADAEVVTDAFVTGDRFGAAVTLRAERHEEAIELAKTFASIQGVEAAETLVSLHAHGPVRGPFRDGDARA